MPIAATSTPVLEELFGSRLLKTEEVRAFLNVAESTFDNLIYSGKLPSIKIGKSRRISEKALATFLQSQVLTPKTPVSE